MSKVKPLLAGGFRDYLPDRQVQRMAIIDRVRRVYERFGFDPLETPAVERLGVLMGGETDTQKLIYRTFVSRGGGWLGREPKEANQKVALRFDLTVPLARVVAANPDVPKPFKRYQIGAVWRGEKPQLGRFREFLQFDADVVGTSDMLADAEMIVIMSTVLRELGFTSFTIRVNNRKILNGLATKGGFDRSPDEVAAVIRVLDKIDKDGLEGVLAELARPASSGDPGGDGGGLGLSPEQIGLVERYLGIEGDIGAVLDGLETFLGDVPLGREGLDELRRIAAYVRDAGVPDSDWRIDPTIARGLDYYTGPIWEAVLDDCREIGTVYSGGRYDTLIGRFMPDAAVPCTGTSVGVDRLFAGMEALGMLDSARTVTEVMIVNFASELVPGYQRLAGELRRAGVATSIYVGEDTSFKAQISYAARQGVPVVVIIGPDDAEAGQVQVKDMRARTQSTVAPGAVVDAVRSILGT